MHLTGDGPPLVGQIPITIEEKYTERMRRTFLHRRLRHQLVAATLGHQQAGRRGIGGVLPRPRPETPGGQLGGAVERSPEHHNRHGLSVADAAGRTGHTGHTGVQFHGRWPAGRCRSL